MQRLLFKGMLMGMTMAMADQGEIDNDATQAMYRAYLKDLIQGEVPGVDVTSEQAEEIAKYLREREAPPPLYIEDGIDADFIKHLKEWDLGFETDEQGRVIVLGVGSGSETPSLDIILARLAPLRHVRDVGISESHIDPPKELMTDDGLLAIAGWTELTTLDVRVFSLTGRAFQLLTRQNPLTRLTILRISGLQDANLALKAVEKCTALREISMRSCDLSDVGLSFLVDLVNLEDLDLNDTNVTGAGLRYLRHLKDLRTLQLEGTAVDDAGLAWLGSLVGLEELWLGGPQMRITDAGLENLARLTCLRKMSLANAKVTAVGLEKLAALVNLDTLSLENTAIGDEAIPALSDLRSLRGLYLTGTRFTPTGIRRLRAALPKCGVEN